MTALGNELGLDRIQAVMGRVGKVEELGKAVNDACPESRTP